MRIVQITPSQVSSKDTWDKWYCSDSVDGPDGDPVIRYLKLDGTWGKITEYFDTRAEVDSALAKGHPPDFSVSSQELSDRAMTRHDLDKGFDYDDDY